MEIISPNLKRDIRKEIPLPQYDSWGKAAQNQAERILEHKRMYPRKEIERVLLKQILTTMKS
jgi:hypothetical protein